MKDAVHHIEDKMAKNVKIDESSASGATPTNGIDDITDTKKCKGPSWRVDNKYFVDSNPSRTFQKGVENYSSGWFAQGHEVLQDPFFNEHLFDFISLLD